MKAVLISIQPKWCELIASGKKTVEVRKTKPKIKTPFKCYIYCTAKKPSDNEWQYKPNLYLDKVENKVRWIDVEFTRTYNCEYLQQRVIGEFVCKGFTYIEAGYDTNENKHLYNTAFIEHQMCIPDNELFDYLYKSRENSGGWGWHISDLVIYDKPKELSEFKKIHRECWYADLGLAKRDCPECKNADCFMQRPPQSWCYVEELR